MRAGATVDGFVLVRSLGSGSGGTAWLARDTKRGTPAIIKLLAEPSRPLFSRLVSALKATSGVEHPNLQVVLRSVQAPELSALGLALEFVEGSRLDELVIDPRRLSLYLGWFADLARALAHLHAAGIAHGGVKPSNVIIGKNAVAKLTDLAWSQLADEPPTAGGDVRALLSVLDQVVLKQLRAVPTTLARMRATTASELVSALEEARRTVGDEAISFQGEPDTAPHDIVPDALVQNVAVASRSEVGIAQVEPSFSGDASTIPQIEAERSTSSLAAWGMVLFALAAMVAASSALWFHVDALERAERGRSLIEQGGAEPPVEKKVLPRLALTSTRAREAIAVDVDVEAKKEPPHDAKPVVLAKRSSAPAGGADAASSSDSTDVESDEVGCDEGDGAACMAFGDRLKRADRLERARLAFERACKFGRATGCTKAAELRRGTATSSAAH